MKRFILGLLVGFVILWVIGCGYGYYEREGTDNAQEKIILSQRQKDILAGQGLPAEYDQLPQHQQRAIVAIEEMLEYAQERYGQSFSYAGYSPAGPLEPEHLQVYPSDGFMETDSFTITKGKDGYEDDFLTVAVKPYWNAYLYRYFQEFLPDTEMKLYTHVTKTTLTELPESKTPLDGEVAGAVYVFLDDTACSLESLNDFKAKVEAFMYDHQMYGRVEIVLLKAGKLIYLSEFNFADYFEADQYECRETVYIKK